MMMIRMDKKPDKQAPREYLLTKLQGQSVFKGEPITTSEGNEGYAIVTRSGSPIDNGLARCDGPRFIAARAFSFSRAPADRQ